MRGAPSLLLAAAAAALPRALGRPGDQVIEVEFQPVEGPPPEAVFDALFSGDQGVRGAFGGRPSSHSHEDALDREIEGMVASMLSSVGNPPAQLLRGDSGRGPSRPSPAGPGRLGSVISSAPNGDIVIEGGPELLSPGGPIEARRPSSMPVEAFRGLFPGPLVVEEHPLDQRAASFGGMPDPLVMDMLQGFGRAFQDDVLPVLHSAGGGPRAPSSCRGDLQAHCSRAWSQLHCLGQHAADVSAPCRKDVGRSVPFACSRAIGRWCDVLRTGVLPCLEARVKDLEGDCRDAVLTTREVIAKTGTHQAVVIDRKSGEKKAVAPPSPKVGGLLPAPMKPPSARRLLYGAVALGATVLVLYRQLGSGAFGGWLRRLGVKGAGGGEGSQLLHGGTELPKPA